MFRQAVLAKPERYFTLKQAINNVRKGVSSANIAFVGDSTTEGDGTGVTVNLRTASYSTQLCTLMNAGGVPCEVDSFFGTGAYSPSDGTYNAYNPMVTFGTGWYNASFQDGPTRNAIYTSGNSVVLITDTSSLYIGQQITATGVTVGTYITAIVLNTSFTMSANATTGDGVSNVSTIFGSFRAGALTMFGCHDPDVGTLAFTPVNTTDTVDIWYIQGVAYGQFTVDIGGGTLQTVDCNGAVTAATSKVTVTYTRGAATVNIKRLVSPTGPIFIVGMHAYDSTTPRLGILNISKGGTTTTSWATTLGNATTPFSSGNILNTILPSMSMVGWNLGINDFNSGVGPEATTITLPVYISNLRSLVGLSYPNSTMMFICPVESNAATAAHASVANQNIRRALIRALSLQYSGILVDIPLLFGSWAGAVQVGWMPNTDDRHPNGPGTTVAANTVLPDNGYGMIAELIYNAIQKEM